MPNTIGLAIDSSHTLLVLSQASSVGNHYHLCLVLAGSHNPLSLNPSLPITLQKTPKTIRAVDLFSIARAVSLRFILQ